jgi:hypothetical protein
MSAFAYLQSASQSGNTALAFPSANVAGNIIVVATSNLSVTSVNDTQGNSYNLVAAKDNGSPQLQIWVALNIKVGANSVTATGLSSGGPNSSIAIIEYTVPSSFSFAVFASYGAGMTNGSNGRYKSSSETLLIIATYDYTSAHSWTGTNLTVRETTTEGGGQTLGIGDFDTATSTTATVSTLNGGSSSSITGSLINFISGGGSTSDIQISVSDPLVVN